MQQEATKEENLQTLTVHSYVALHKLDYQLHLDVSRHLFVEKKELHYNILNFTYEMPLLLQLTIFGINKTGQPCLIPKYGVLI